MNKKAVLGDFILKAFTILVYIMFVMIALIILRLPGCTNEDDATEIIRSNSPETLQLRAEQQLTTYLRTPMPDNLLERIEKIRQMDENGEFESTQTGEPASKWNGIVDTIEFRLEGGRTLLERHPETYKGQTYAGFIAALKRYTASEPEKANAAFDIATRAVFVQKYEERITRKTSKEIYASPIIIVKYDTEIPTPITTKPAPSAGDMRSIGDFCGSRPGCGVASSPAVAVENINYAATLIPTEEKPAMVQLNAPVQTPNTRLPQP